MYLWLVVGHMRVVFALILQGEEHESNEDVNEPEVNVIEDEEDLVKNSYIDSAIGKLKILVSGYQVCRLMVL